MNTSLAVFFICFANYLFAQSSNFEPSQILPLKINQWERAVPDRIYEGEELYDYIDGGAELFLSFGFNRVFN